MIKIAIVGADESKWTKEQKEKVKEIIRTILRIESGKLTIGEIEIDFNLDITLISGHCPKGGVDIWAEEIADELGIPKEIYAPKKESRCWYRKRNMKIASACDILYCIEPKGRKISGGLWTLEYAKKLGKEVHFIEIE